MKRLEGRQTVKLKGNVAVGTGGAQGMSNSTKKVSRRGVKVVIADIDQEAG